MGLRPRECQFLSLNRNDDDECRRKRRRRRRREGNE